MTRLTVDPQWEARLTSEDGPIALCSQDGRTLGYFHPEKFEVRVGNEETGSPYSIEELKQIAAEPGEYTLDEIVRQLRAS